MSPAIRDSATPLQQTLLCYPSSTFTMPEVPTYLMRLRGLNQTLEYEDPNESDHYDLAPDESSELEYMDAIELQQDDFYGPENDDYGELFSEEHRALILAQ
ncbi:hypothetical protein IL306_007442 [Fusarium sp. DS 682]|nr:hypothetical protein IL306_007442 [Fusarium sp. DS 682]